MGCDIHPYIEYREVGNRDAKDEYGRQWVSFAGEQWIPRSYQLFTALAGVRDRDGVGCKYQPRGLPEHTGYEINLDAVEHTPSWLTLAELEEVTESGRSQGWWPEVSAIIAAMKDLERTGHDTRLVFWFDN